MRPWTNITAAPLSPLRTIPLSSEDRPHGLWFLKLFSPFLTFFVDFRCDLGNPDIFCVLRDPLALRLACYRVCVVIFCVLRDVAMGVCIMRDCTCKVVFRHPPCLDWSCLGGGVGLDNFGLVDVFAVGIRTFVFCVCVVMTVYGCDLVCGLRVD